MNYTYKSSDRINAAIEKALATERGGTRIDKAIEKALASENTKSRIDRAIEKARAAENSGIISTPTTRTSSGNTTSVGGGVLDAPKTSQQIANTKPLTGFAAGVQANNAGYKALVPVAPKTQLW